MGIKVICSNYFYWLLKEQCTSLVLLCYNAVSSFFFFSFTHSSCQIPVLLIVTVVLHCNILQ